MIDIIIPAYNAHESIKKTLASIAIQTIIKKCNVFIVNDGSTIDYSEEINFFNNYMNISELKIMNNKGIGYARNFGLKNSRGEFLMFIDADDVLNDCFSIENLYNNIKYDYDYVVSYVLVEKEEKKFTLEKFFNGNLHGKIYKRKFIEENEISFNDVRMHEDNMFNSIIFLCNPKINCVHEVTYIYKNNVNSLTKTCNNYFETYISSMELVMKKMEKANNKKYNNFIFSTILYLYYSYLDIEDNKENFIKWCNKLYKYYDKYCNNNCDKNEIIKERTIEILNTNKVIDKFLLPNITFENFLELIKNKNR